MALIILVVLAIILFAVLCEALMVAVVGDIFFDYGFWDSCHVAWSKPGWLLVFALVTLLSQGVRRR